MRWGIILAVAMLWMGGAQAAPVEGVGDRYLAACSMALLKLNIPATVGDCERLLGRSHLIQSEAIRYLAQTTDAERQAFGAASTLGRYDLIMPEDNHVAVVNMVLTEKETAAQGMIGQLVKDIMDPGCGYYQIDIILRALDDAKVLPSSPKQASRKSAHTTFKGCLGGAFEDGKVEKCLNPIFKPVISEPSPNP